ncbi:glycoside hydrolase family 28 protein [Desarmillaria tabescens]|uniref:endo-polygalacturonase n=1 Tax=Armillaria tabescens TaxID=1929756 RepID=A0AA39N097_ARMTA|nr:glycoside hydrolase family 28 protein [Desarmillaria tabescens]KAK0452733.1 glycoside hydrolase family 28 protein [Desarmillaria tabescens]
MFQHAFHQFVFTTVVLALMSAIPTGELEEHASCMISSVLSASSILSCSSVTISAFTVPSRSMTIIMAGDITFAKTSSDRPLFTINGDDITFNGMGYSFDGNSAKYWDGEGTNGSVDKPHPFLKFKGSGTYSNFTVLNSPAQAISIGNSDSLVFDSITIHRIPLIWHDGDDDDLGHNTDGFDVSANDVTIQNSVVKNQDDCIAINDGSNIIFKNNKCLGSHGILIGSISSGKSVTDVTISGNTVMDSMYGFRIKVKASATSMSVSSITYSGNTLSGINEYGVLITQSYPDDEGTPGTGGPILDINFTRSTTTIKVGDDAKHLAVDCGACSGTWDFSKLKITGRSAGNS